MAVDMLRSCYATDVQWGPDPGQRGRIRWYFCAPDAAYFPYPNVFRSLNYLDRNWDTAPPIGEIGGAPRPWSTGRRPAAGTEGVTPCGPPEWWANGLPSGQPDATVPPCYCCTRAEAGGVAAGGLSELVPADQGGVAAGGLSELVPADQGGMAAGGLSELVPADQGGVAAGGLSELVPADQGGVAAGGLSELVPADQGGLAAGVLSELVPADQGGLAAGGTDRYIAGSPTPCTSIAVRVTLRATGTECLWMAGYTVDLTSGTSWSATLAEPMPGSHYLHLALVTMEDGSYRLYAGCDDNPDGSPDLGIDPYVLLVPADDCTVTTTCATLMLTCCGDIEVCAEAPPPSPPPVTIACCPDPVPSALTVRLELDPTSPNPCPGFSGPIATTALYNSGIPGWPCSFAINGKVINITLRCGFLFPGPPVFYTVWDSPDINCPQDMFGTQVLSAVCSPFAVTQRVPSNGMCPCGYGSPTTVLFLATWTP